MGSASKPKLAQTLFGIKIELKITMQKRILLLFLFNVFLLNAQAQSVDPLRATDAEAQQIWVDNLMNSMTIEEKIGHKISTDFKDFFSICNGLELGWKFKLEYGNRRAERNRVGE